MADYTGRMVGQYEIRSVLGISGVSKVYQAYQASQSRDVAIKILPKEFLGDQTFIERFDREVNIVAHLKHPNIVPIYDYGVIDDNPYLVTAYYKGHALDRHIPQFLVGMPLIETSKIITQIANALNFAHNEGIIHRNVKPSNILLDLDGNAYLFDFGIAKIVEASAELTGDKVLGSPTYMAPEMGSPGGVTPLVDIYALGVTCFEMLTGRPPYHADHEIGILLAHVKQPIPKIKDLRPDLPEAVQNVIDKVLAKNPAQRYQTAIEFSSALRMVVERDDSTDYLTPPIGRKKPGTGELELVLKDAIPIDAKPEDRPAKKKKKEPPLTTKPDPQLAEDMKNGEAEQPADQPAPAKRTHLGEAALVEHAEKARSVDQAEEAASAVPIKPVKHPTPPPTSTGPYERPVKAPEKKKSPIPRHVTRWIWMVLAIAVMLGFVLLAVIAIALFSGVI